MRLKYVIGLLGLGVLFFAALSAIRPGADASHAPGAISLLYIDMDSTGNTATSLGVIEECATISGIGSFLDIDIAIADWPANGDALASFQLVMSYDPAIVQVSSAGWNFLVADIAGSNVANIGEGGDSDGTLRLATIDLSTSDETSAGVLARVTLESIGAGQSTLSLSSPSAYILTDQSTGSYVPVTQVDNAFVAVNQSCVPGSQPGPTPPPLPPEACSNPTDTDSDYFSDCIESFVGTDPLVPCAADSAKDNEPEPDAWPLDYNDDQVVNLYDVLRFVPFFRDPLSAYDARYDLNTDGVVSLLDMLWHKTLWGVSCTDFPPLTPTPTPNYCAGEVWPVPAGDADCDGFTSADEESIGTDPTDRCADTLAENDEADDKWPPDFDDNRVVNTTDVFQLLPPTFGTAVPPTSVRRDLFPDGVINTTDVFRVLPPFLGSSCTP